MIAKNFPVVTPMGGKYFEVCVWLARRPPNLRAYFSLPPANNGPEIFDRGMECTRDQLQELIAMSTMAIAMIDQLENQVIITPGSWP